MKQDKNYWQFILVYFPGAALALLFFKIAGLVHIPTVDASLVFDSKHWAARAFATSVFLLGFVVIYWWLVLGGFIAAKKAKAIGIQKMDDMPTALDLMICCSPCFANKLWKIVGCSDSTQIIATRRESQEVIEEGHSPVETRNEE